ncbi:peptidase T [Pseudoponticoccus marisrubri]|uniref:Peptidase T n=1 Tax=Pseudoponticoccus marisrubri TaxID=1685382 RepID=A0A0W7WHN6_9RHOB|nr:peptidase T [Pseudoponticoccus marisrubri]
MSAELEERLLRYTAIDSQSDSGSDTTPSTDVQFDMLNLLVEELTAMGAADVTLTGYGTVLAGVPGTVPGPTIALLAHVDTTEQFAASGVKPRVLRNYDGGEIRFPDAPDLVLSPAHNAYLGTKAGDDIITASGTTLLGADDKAGVAIIMTVLRHLLETPDLSHPPLRIAFTPDEEIGRGVHPDLPGDLGADFGYTLDGGEIGRIDYDSFSADAAEITVTGVSVHPGKAKGKLVSAITLASRIMTTLPQGGMTPELTEGHEGFIHATEMSGNAAEMKISLILRDFEMDGLEEKGRIVRAVCDAVQATEPRARITCEIRKQYRNMRYALDSDMTPVTLARDAMAGLGIEARSEPLRGGTDGSRLTELGLPTPNLFTGMQEIHGPLEWISVQDMTAATQVCLAILDAAGSAD